MINIFKSSAVQTIVSTKNKTTNEIITEIHETFYTEVDKLLASAKIAHSLDTTKQDLIDKCARLKVLGFTNTKEVKEAEAEITRLDKLKLDNDAKKVLIEAITYFSMKYPNYKFITEESVKKICDKYGLVYGNIDRYIGDVPDVNLKHIEEFKVLEEDECHVHISMMSGFRGWDLVSQNFISHAEYEKEQDRKNELKSGKNTQMALMQAQMSMYHREVDMKCPLEIAAPQSDFDMTGHEIKDHKISKIQIPDPIVLKPVIYNHQKYYLIVTAWGIEASDELVVNERHN